nr:hypothetical protein [uncultured Mediterranean phage uvMED]
MIKQIEVTLLVEVDTEDEEICPSGNPLLENVVLNTVDDGFFMSPVKVLSVKDLEDSEDLLA